MSPSNLQNIYVGMKNAAVVHRDDVEVIAECGGTTPPPPRSSLPRLGPYGVYLKAAGGAPIAPRGSSHPLPPR